MRIEHRYSKPRLPMPTDDDRITMLAEQIAVCRKELADLIASREVPYSQNDLLCLFLFLEGETWVARHTRYIRVPVSLDPFVEFYPITQSPHFVRTHAARSSHSSPPSSLLGLRGPIHQGRQGR